MNAEFKRWASNHIIGYEIFFVAVHASKSALQPLKISDGISLDESANQDFVFVNNKLDLKSQLAQAWTILRKDTSKEQVC